MSVPGTRPEHAAETAPPCRHFGTCGGCSFLDQPIGRQLAHKQAAVARLLAPHLEPGVEVKFDPPPHLPVHTRTKLSWPVQPDARGALALGMYAAGSHRVVAIEQCQVQDPALTRLQKRALQVLRAAGVSPYDERAHTGFVRAFHARLVAGSGELMIGLTTRAGLFEKGPAIAAELLDAARGLRDARGRVVRAVGVVRSIHDDPGNALLGNRQVPLKGRDYQIDQVAGMTFKVGFGSFYQSHRNAEAVLFRPALAMLGDVSGLRVVDGYGGVGTFGLRLARAGAATVEIVEANPSACADARDNAVRNALEQVTVVEQAFGLADLAAAPDICVVDPPRKGLEEDGVRQLLALRPARALYVSCSAAALARDLGPLRAGGYRVRAVRIADLFPHTEHVETLALLERRD